MATSVVFHTLLLVWLAFLPRTRSESEPLTEITFLDPGDLAPASAASGEPAPGPRSVRGTPTTNVPDVRFRRSELARETTPEPESPISPSDRLSNRLATLQSQAVVRVQGLSPTAGAGPSWNPGPARETSRVGGGGSSPLPLTRGGGGTGPPLELTRGGAGSGGAPALVAAQPKERPAAPASAPSGDSNARRNLAGATLIGPLADRAIVNMVKPVYPVWAKRDAVEGSVTLYFVVRPDGSVKENVMVQKTAGFEDFDESARTALRDWRFQSLRPGVTGEQWGTITFRFRLRDAG